MNGGIRTLADLKLRCHCEAGGCWEWRFSCSQGRGKPEPRVWMADWRRCTTLSRAVWHLSGKPPVQRVWRTCRNTLCGNPAHLMGGTQAEWGAWMTASGHLRGCPIRSARNKAKSQHRRVLTDEQIAMVRDSDEMGTVLARKLGVSPHAISRARRQVYTRLLKGASVFSLGAR